MGELKRVMNARCWEYSSEKDTVRDLKGTESLVGNPRNK